MKSRVEFLKDGVLRLLAGLFFGVPVGLIGIFCLSLANILSSATDTTLLPDLFGLPYLSACCFLPFMLLTGLEAFFKGLKRIVFVEARGFQLIGLLFGTVFSVLLYLHYSVFLFDSVIVDPDHVDIERIEYSLNITVSLALLWVYLMALRLLDK